MARPTQRTKAKSRTPAQRGHNPGTRRTALMLGVPAVMIAVLSGLLLWQRGVNDRTVAAADPGPVHVHGLGVNPADGALFIATHTGLFRTEEGQTRAARVGDGFQDTMGFTVVGPNRFLGSGHPDVRDSLPPLLGLIESTDAGASWKPVSLLGEADFHVLRFTAGRLYGYDATNDRLMASADKGRTWRALTRPGGLLDVAADPADASRLVASGESQFGPALFESTDGGQRWVSKASLSGLLAWPDSGKLYVATETGEVFRSPDRGRSIDLRGRIGGRPAAFAAEGPDDLYVALHDGTVKRSIDGGASWTVRSAP